MVSKTRAHRIRNISETQFRGFIDSLDWELDEPKHDYGLDFWSEVFKEGNPTGDIFRVQLKGTETLNEHYSTALDQYYYDVPLKRLNDWFKNFVPVYFILWDIIGQKGYWLHVQAFILENLQVDTNWLDQQKKDQKKRIYLPSAQLIQIGQSNGFETNLASNLSKLRDSGAFQEWFEAVRGISWQDLRAKIQDLENGTEFAAYLDTERTAALELAVITEPENLAHWMEKAELHYEQHQFSEALAAINQARELDDASLDVLALRACILCEYANANAHQPRHFYIEAIENFNQSAEIITTVSLHYNLGNCYLGLGDYRKAIEEFDLALAAQPSAGLEAQIWKNRGSCFDKLGDQEEEKVSYEKAIEKDPEHWQGYFSLAAASVQARAYAEAEQYMETGLKYVPNFTEVLVNGSYLLAHAKWKLGKDTEALPLANLVLKLMPQHEDAYLLKAHLLMALWRQNASYIAEAKRFFGLWVLTDPQNIMAKGELHLIFKACGELDEARKVIKEALDSSDHVPAMMFYDYAMLLKDEGKTKEAIEQLLKAAEIETNHSIEHQLGHLYFAKKDYRNALEWYQKALKSSILDRERCLWDIANSQFLLNKPKEAAITMMELLLFDPAQEDCRTNLLLALHNSGYKDLSRRADSSLKKSKEPTELAKIFDSFVAALMPGHKQDWWYFQPHPAASPSDEEEPN